MKHLLVAACLFVVLPMKQAPAVPLKACLGRNLGARADFQGATGAQEGGVVLRNRTEASCMLSGHAVIDFVVRGETRPLPVRVAAGRDTHGRLHDRTILLAPGQRAFVHAHWSNWCGEVSRKIEVRLWLRSVEPRVHVRGGISTPRCDDSAGSSRVAIGPYERVRRYR